MFVKLTGNHAHPVNVNQRKSLIATIYLAVVGPAVFIIQPGFVQGLVEYNGFSEQQAGYVASVEMWGIAIMTLLMTFISHKINWRNALVWASLAAAAGNFLSIFTQDVILFAALRGMTGVGSGVLISLTFTIIGLTSNPDRNFGFLIMWVLVYGALGFLLMPIAYSAVGLSPVLLFFALFNLSALFFIRNLPSSGQEHLHIEEGARELPTVFKGLAIATLFIYFMAQGVIWAYLFLIGTAAEVSENSVTSGLTISQFFGIAGALTAAMLGNRFGRTRSISVGVFASIGSLVMLLGNVSPIIYGVAVSIFNYAWNMTHPFMLGALAMFDRSGKIVVHGIASQMLGLAIGPAIAASLVSAGDYSSIIWVGGLLFLLSLVAIAPPLWKYQQKDASSQSPLAKPLKCPIKN